MATTSGHEGIAKVGGNAVAEVIGFSFTKKTSPVEDTELSDKHKTFKTGGKDETDGSITCQWDVTDVTGQEAMAVDAEVTLNLFPQGDEAGGRFYSGSVIITEMGVENSDGSTVQRSLSWVSNGGLTLGTVA